MLYASSNALELISMQINDGIRKKNGTKPRDSIHIASVEAASSNLIVS